MKTFILPALIAVATFATTAAAQQQSINPRTTLFHFDIQRDETTGRNTLGNVGIGSLDRSTREPVSMRQVLSAIARHNASAESSTDRIVIRDTAFGREASSAGPNGLSADARRAIAIQNATAADASERIYVEN